MKSPSVVIADDAVLLREGLAKLLESRGFEVLGHAGDAENLLRLMQTCAPDVALIDIRMPPTGTDEGLRAAHDIGEEFPAVAVMILSDHLDTEYAIRLISDDVPGRGYWLKSSVTDVDDFADALRRVVARESVIDPIIVRRLLVKPRVGDPLDLLTAREREILQMIAEGRSNAGIAARVHLSERTVEGHIANVFQKLGLRATADDHRRVLAVLAFLQK